MNNRWPAIIVAGLVLLAAGIWIWSGDDDPSETPADDVAGGVVQDDSGRRVLYWYDPMTPQHRFDKPGKSPFMDMQLVPKYADEHRDSRVQISPSVQQNLGVRLAQAQHTRFGDALTTVGRIEPDERRRYVVASRAAGFVERLLVRAMGDPVSAGEKLAEIYAPELFSAQLEFLALQRAEHLNAADSLVGAARQRLILFGMADHEIESIQRSGQAQRRFGVYAAASGYVAELNVREGAQIEAGAALMSIADLSSVWLIADVPEREASRIAKGEAVLARLEAAPAKTFPGVVDFIYPTLDRETRTARVRIVLPNRSGELRPGMFAEVSLAGAQREALTIPTQAIIYTGSRMVVIVKDEHGFRPVEVQTGLEGEGRTEILAGLSAGDEVVASGQFLIDSEASLSAALARLSAGEEAPR